MSQPADAQGLASVPKRVLGRPAKKVLRALGYDLVRTVEDQPKPIPVDIDDVARGIIERVRPYTMTPPERVAVLCDAVRYVVRSEIPGAILECGVWRGGSMMAAALTLASLGRDDRELYLFDLFEKMPPPGERDFDAKGQPASLLFEGPVDANSIPELANLPMEEVRRVVESTGYPAARIHFVKGLVEDTVPDHAPDQIAILRLDTDWYESTAHEMKHLFPRIADGGVLIVDDYGIFRGARDAVDEYLAEHDIRLLLGRVDHAARMAVVHHDH
jgi:O-methyltransferase